MTQAVSLGTFLTLLFLVQPAFSQIGTIYGTITDSETGEGLAAATIQVSGGGVLADFDGRYQIELPADTYELTFRYVGYEAKTRLVEVRADERTEVNISLLATGAILETATVTSGRYEKALGEVTVSLEVLKPSLIQNTNQTSLDGALDKVPGVSIIDGQANIRGGSGWSYGAGSRVLLLVDDIPILSSDAGVPNWDDVPIENLEQVEIVKGAASALYGSSALNGIINVRTGFARSEPETKISTYGIVYLSPSIKEAQWWDSPPTEWGGSVRHARKIGRLDLVTSAFYNNFTSFQKDAFDRYGRYTTNLQYRLSDRLTLGLNFNYNEGRGRSFFYWAGLDSLQYIGAPGTESNTNPMRFNIDPRITFYDGLGNRHRFLGRYYRTNNRNDANRANSSDVLYGEYQFLRRWSDFDLVLTAGLVGQATSAQAELYGDTTYRSENFAGYFQLDKKVGDRLNLSAGLRFEYNALFSPEFVGGDTIPDGRVRESKPVVRIGANYRAGEASYLRASFGQGYRYPTVAEKFIETSLSGVIILPNPSLESETGWSAEVGLKQGFKVSDFSGYVDIAGFWSQYENMIEFNIPQGGEFGFSALNVGGTVIRGGEITVGGRGSLFGYPTAVLAGYTYIDPQFQEFDPTLPPGGGTRTLAQRNAELSSSDENILKYRFQHSAKFDIETKFNRLSVGVSGIYNSRIEAIDAVFELLVVPGLRQWRAEETGTFLLGSRLAYQINDQFKLSVLGKNLLNEAYVFRPGFLEGPRNIGVRLDVEL